MDNKENSLEELKKIREQLKIELEEMMYEEKVVVAATYNPKQLRLINALRNYNLPTKHSIQLLKAQNRKNSEKNPKINTSKVINYYRTLTGVDVNKTSITALPVEDSADKCCYLYEVEAQIEKLQFKITYCSNKPPDDLSQSNEILKQITITFASSNLQKEAQEDLDFISQNSTNIYNAVLFLKEFYKFNKIRKIICSDLINKHKNYLSIVIKNNQICIICKGVKRPDETFMVHWKIKLDRANYTVTDSFHVQTSLLDKQLIPEIQDVFKQICTHSNWSKLSENHKLQVFNRAIISLVEADDRARDVSAGSSITDASFSSS